MKLRVSVAAKRSLGETRPGVGVIAKVEHSPLDSGTQCLFAGITGGLHSFLAKEGKQTHLILEDALGPSTDHLIASTEMAIGA
jgi:hypothetical protein